MPFDLAIARRVDAVCDAFEFARRAGDRSDLADWLGRDADQNVWADLNGSNSLQMRRLFLEGSDQLLARVSAGGTAGWYDADHLGSVRDIVNYAGTMVLDQVAFDAYGNKSTETTPANGDRYGYTGRESESVTGLQYNRTRWYDTRTGSWISQDSIGFNAGDVNLYRYVGTNPTNAADPIGEAAAQANMNTAADDEDNGEITFVAKESRAVTKGRNGYFDWGVDWKVTSTGKNPKLSGIVLQHVTINFDIKSAAGTKLKISEIVSKPSIASNFKPFQSDDFTFDYFEAWGVSTGGKVVWGLARKGSNDTFGISVVEFGKIPTNSAGTITFKGSATYLNFIGKSDIAKEDMRRLGFRDDLYGPPGKLWCASAKKFNDTIKDNLSKIDSDSFGPADHSITVSWTPENPLTKVDSQKISP
jgi:RHS repeat-associated protein